MHNVIAFLKNAVTRDSSANVAGCYIFRDGTVYARNNSLQAGIAVGGELNINVPADELDAALARMSVIKSMEVNADNITLKAGRLRSSIRLNSDEAPEMPDMPDLWTPCPVGFTAALKQALPFLGNRGWTEGVCLMDERIVACSNNRAIDIRLENLEIEPTLIDQTVAEFIIAQGDPDELYRGPQWLLMRWDDGRWVRAQLIADAIPIKDIENLFRQGGTEAPVVITPEWREAFDDAANLSKDGIFTMTPNGLEASRDASLSNIDLEIAGLPDDHVSRWDSAVLKPMLECATAWNPVAYPNPCLFTGPGLRGLVMGIRR